ncbi:hypothetical protein [Methylocystis sp. SC2]|uniref:hypothetical protein n=1 Tax=Methylocystis sp. (strain SC2) TaxID=187303 RepID=UPI00027AED83|nr:hypothetical protein [Methylocystis sp. SC2]CCJ06970.1 Conserved hypothetical protein [Methylocystis sp. SC2]
MQKLVWRVKLVTDLGDGAPEIDVAAARIKETSLQFLKRLAFRSPKGSATAFVESAVNEILSKRMIKEQQMRWHRWTVQPFLDARVAVRNKTLPVSLRRLYPDFQPDNENRSVRLSA